MYKTIAAAILAMSVASPVLAQSYDPDLGTGNLGSAPAYSSTASKNHHVMDSYAQAGHGAVKAGTATAGDHDAFIQLELTREAQFGL